MSELKVITQAQLLTTTRDLRDRVEISLHKLGPGAKSIQTNLNAIVATLSVQNAHPVDDKQPDLFGAQRVGQPSPRQPRRKSTLDEEWQTHKAKRESSQARPKERKLQNNYRICAQCSSVEPDKKMVQGKDKKWRCKKHTAELTSKERKSIDRITTSVNCSKCNIALQKTEMKRTAGHRWICKDCAKKTDKKDWSDYVQGKGKYKPPSAKKAAKNAPKKAAKHRKPNAAFMAPYTTSVPELQAIIGTKPQPRTDVTKKIWDYIKKHGLQDKANRRMINCDDKLRVIFAKKNGSAPKQVSMFEMTKLVTRHLTPVKQ